MNVTLEGCAIAQAVGSWRLKAEVRVWSHVSPCGIYGGQYGNRTSFPASTSVFPCQYHSTDVPYSFLSTFSSYQQDKLAKPGNLKEQSSFVYRGTLDRRVISLFPGSEVSCQSLSSLQSPPAGYLLAGGGLVHEFSCLVYTKTDAATICTVWCCYLHVTVRTAEQTQHTSHCLLLLPSLAPTHNYWQLWYITTEQSALRFHTLVDRSIVTYFGTSTKCQTTLQLQILLTMLYTFSQ